jgi:signal transduction histidine kinase
VLADRVQLQQVLINLVINGAEAMASVTDRERLLLVATDIDDTGAVRVAVTDSGTGIDPGDLERIFEPFFTTKSSGMGMGLSICRSIVESHGGRLWVASTGPNGTTFNLTLPSIVASG